MRKEKGIGSPARALNLQYIHHIKVMKNHAMQSKLKVRWPYKEF